MKIALAQMNSNDDLERNCQQMINLVKEAAERSLKERPKIIFFPENSLYFRINSSELIPKIDISCDQIKNLEQLSRQYGIYLHFTNSLFFENKNWNASVLISHEKKNLLKC